MPLLARGWLLFMLTLLIDSMHFERTNEQFRHSNLLESYFLPSRGYEQVIKTLKGFVTPSFYEAASIAASMLQMAPKSGAGN